MARSHIRLVLLAAVAAIAALALAGCGGGGSGGGKDLSAGLSAQQLLTRSADEAAKLDTFTIALDGTAQADVPPGPYTALFRKGPIAVSGEGQVDPPDKASIDATLKLAALSPQVNLTRVGDAVYVGILGEDFRLAVPGSTVRLLDLGRLYPTLAGWIADPVRSPGGDIDGAPTVEVSGRLDPAKVMADLGPLLRGGGAAIPPARAAKAVQKGTVEAWIGTQDLRPRRVHVVLKAAGLGGKGAPVRALDLDLTATLSAFDEPVDISAPANARPLDLNSLGGLGVAP